MNVKNVLNGMNANKKPAMIFPCWPQIALFCIFSAHVYNYMLRERNPENHDFRLSLKKL